MNNRSFGNPAFSENSFRGESDGTAMTRGGVVLWLTALLIIFGGTFSFTMKKGMEAMKDIDFNLIEDVATGEKDKDGDPVTVQRYRDVETGEYTSIPPVDLSRVMTLMWIGCIGGFCVAMLTIFVKPLAPFTAPIYAALEGFALGGISAAYELKFGGIVMQAAAGTFGTLIVMYGMYISGVIKVGNTFTRVITAALFGVVVVYIIDLILPMVGGEHLSIIHSNSWASIGFSGLVCLLAAFCLAVDFETVEDGIRMRAPKYMAAYSAFSILVTLFWLYLEILRLLAKTRSRN